MDVSFVNPSSINAFQATVKPVTYENLGLGTAYPQAGIAGHYYHDGTPGVGLTGDVGGQVNIIRSGTSLAAWWFVWRFNDETGADITILASAGFTTPISLGNTYTLFLGWDGSQILR